MTMSHEKALARLLLCKPMKLKDLRSALEGLGKFTLTQSKRKQSHYMVRRDNRLEPFTLPVGHDGEVSDYWVGKLVRHFALNETVTGSGEQNE